MKSEFKMTIMRKKNYEFKFRRHGKTKKITLNLQLEFREIRIIFLRRQF